MARGETRQLVTKARGVHESACGTSLWALAACGVGDGRVSNQRSSSCSGGKGGAQKWVERVSTCALEAFRTPFARASPLPAARRLQERAGSYGQHGTFPLTPGWQGKHFITPRVAPRYKKRVVSLVVRSLPSTSPRFPDYASENVSNQARSSFLHFFGLRHRPAGPA